MKILWISLYPPLPLNFGGPVGIYKRLVELSKYNTIFLFYINEDNNPKYDIELRKLCSEVYSYRRNCIFNIDTLKYLFTYPYTAATRNITLMQKDMQKCIEQNRIDLINVEFPQMCINLYEITKKYPQIPVVLHEHNNEWLRFKQMGNTVKIIKKTMYNREAALLFKLEKKIGYKNLIKLYTFLSDKDQRQFIESFGVERKRTALVPLGADIMEKLQAHKHKSDKIIMFCAAMDSELNQEAAIWFVNEIFPIIKEEIKNVKFYIVGRKPNNEIIELADNDVIVTGTVDSLSEYYTIADLVVIPLLHGGGVKVKLLEAIGYGKNIVTTSIGIEGTLFGVNEIPVFDDENSFAKGCIDILMNEKIAQKYRENTKKIFLENYTWEKIGKKYNALLENLITYNGVYCNEIQNK